MTLERLLEPRRGVPMATLRPFRRHVPANSNLLKVAAHKLRGVRITMSQRTRMSLLSTSAMPALIWTALLGGTPAKAGETILLAQQQEPAEQKDRPRRPDGAPGQKG